MKGIIIASFGTTHMDAFGASIERIKNRLKIMYPDIYTVHSFSSEMVRNALKKENIHYFNMPEALLHMEEKGIRDISVLALYVIPGIEYEKIKKQARVYNNDKRLNVRFSEALLTDERDMENVAEVLKNLFFEKPTILMGHGTTVEVDQAYLGLQNKLDEMGEKIYVGTVEGSLVFEDVLEKLEQIEEREVLLTPFLLVAGDHAKNDMGSDEKDSWASMLREKGFDVEVELKGLCERIEINDLFYKKLEEILWN